MNLTLRRCRCCFHEFLELKTVRKAKCIKCGGPASVLRDPKLFYHADILWAIGWLALTVGAYWIWQHYKNNGTETLFMALLVCCPFLVLILVMPARFFQWDRWRKS